MATPAHAQATPCLFGEVQSLLGQAAPQNARIAGLLADCERATPGDWRVHWLKGVHARDQQSLPQALAALQRAHALAPDEPAPALDLAVVHEWRSEPAQAAALYAKVLAVDPASRPAALGMARVARAEGRQADARAIYDRMLAANPRDADALNGIAWLEADALRIDAAQQRFEAALAAQPGNAEATQGLQQLQQAWRYQLDLGVGSYDLAAGHATSAGAGLRINLSATQQLELALARYSRELPSVRLTDPTPLPSWLARVGYRAKLSSDLTWTGAYEYRERSNNPAEHRIELGLGGRVTGPLGWFAGVRQGFGSDAWDNRLVHAGLSYDIARGWSVAGTWYAGDSKLGGHSKAVALDLYRETGAMGLLFNVGIGHSPDPDNNSVHARLIYPVAPRQSLMLSIEHRSLGSELEAMVGWRYHWR